MYKVVPQLLREFEVCRLHTSITELLLTWSLQIRLVHPDREWITENFWVVRHTDMDVYFERRVTLANRAVQLDEKPSL
jgi:hypothetical protein